MQADPRGNSRERQGQRRTIFNRSRYVLAARLAVSEEERAAIYGHALNRYEIFHDPHRDQLLQRAQAADQRARALPWLPPTDKIAATIGKDALETTRYIVLTLRALAAFRITIGNLVEGVVVEHHRLNAIREIDHAMTEAVDAIAAAVGAALAFEHSDEEVLAPGEPDDTTPPAKWLKWL